MLSAVLSLQCTLSCWCACTHVTLECRTRCVSTLQRIVHAVKSILLRVWFLPSLLHTKYFNRNDILYGCLWAFLILRLIGSAFCCALAPKHTHIADACAYVHSLSHTRKGSVSGNPPLSQREPKTKSASASRSMREDFLWDNQTKRHC